MISGIPAMASAEVVGKAVLVRADLNVPMRDRTVTDVTRLEHICPAIRGLAVRGARVVLMSHLGRPKSGFDPELSLRPIADALSNVLGCPIEFLGDCMEGAAKSRIRGMNPGSAGLLENLRFHPGEEANADGFAQNLAALADLYINDAFSCAHRAHASTHAITRYLPAYAGPMMQAELSALSSILENPNRPLAAVVGGAKVSSKIAVLENLLPRVDYFVIGGGMANTFLLAQGWDVGRSLAEPLFVETARRILAAAAEHNVTIILPVDVVAAKALARGASHIVTSIGAVPSTHMILDIGPGSIAILSATLGSIRTLLWNGPLGAFEIEPFGTGTFAVAREAASLTEAGRLTSVAGGGDTAAALNCAGVAGSFTYLSTAGGAFLEWLEGKTLPGVEALIRHNPLSRKEGSWPVSHCDSFSTTPPSAAMGSLRSTSTIWNRVLRSLRLHARATLR
jgi:phosphoglycerate kinase